MTDEKEDTDLVLWRDNADDPFSPRLFVTTGGGIGMAVDGQVFVLSVRGWHGLARLAYSYNLDRLPVAATDRCKHGVWAADHCYECADLTK